MHEPIQQSEVQRVTFYWQADTIGIYGHDDHGNRWHTSSLSQPESCAICETPIIHGYRSSEGAFICARHVDFVTVRAVPPPDREPDDYDATITWELRAQSLVDEPRRAVWKFVDGNQARQAFEDQKRLANEAASTVTMTLAEIDRKAGTEAVLAVY